MRTGGRPPARRFAVGGYDDRGAALRTSPCRCGAVHFPARDSRDSGGGGARGPQGAQGRARRRPGDAVSDWRRHLGDRRLRRREVLHPLSGEPLARRVRVVPSRARSRGHRLAAARMMQWLRRSFIAGFLVTVPLFISVVAFIMLFDVVDGLTTPLYDRLLGRRIPGLGVLSTVIAVVLVGAVATNVIGKRALQRAEGWLLRVPVFRTIYAPVKQLVVAFSPDNESGFKRVVMVEDARRGFALGFLTREFTVDCGTGPVPMIAVYVPTNNLYLGDVVICERDRAAFPDISVEEGVKIFLTGGMALPARIRL